MKDVLKREPCILCGHHRPGRKLRDGVCLDCIDDNQPPGFDTDRRTIPMGKLPKVEFTLGQIAGHALTYCLIVMAVYGVVRFIARIVMGV